MAGEIWQQVVQIGKETQYGTPAAATRVAYFREPVFTRTREPREHRFPTGTRDNLRNVTLGPIQVGGTLVQPLSAEAIELFLIGIKGGVAASGVGEAKTWTFTPGTLDSLTAEWHDGARPWQVAGVYANSLQIAGSVNGENLITAEVFGAAMIQKALTPALQHRTPAVFEGWETKIAVDPIGDTAGTTNVPKWLLEWEITLTNNLARKYHADNTLNASRVTAGELAVSASLLVEASEAASLAEFNNWEGQIKRLVQLEFGNNVAIGEGPDKEKITIDLPGAWTAVDLGEANEGTRAYRLEMTGVYDTVNQHMFKAEVTTARATAF
jgi:hypothetical protein